MTQTLAQALKLARDTRWRDNDSCYSQAKIAVRDLTQWAYPHFPMIGAKSEAERLLVGDIAETHIRDVTRQWYADGIAPATINKRLNCLSALGVNVNGCREKLKPALKWWLRPEEEERAIKFLEVSAPGDWAHTYANTMSDFIRWTTRTGLRIEESLRLRNSDFTWGRDGGLDLSVTVPGLKTATSQATLPLSATARDIARPRLGHPDGMWGGLSYDTLKRQWSSLRTAMCWEGNGVTLKALRRSAARHLHVDCGMPLDMVRHYLRHEDLETTLGYLRLTGGYGTEEMRRYLK